MPDYARGMIYAMWNEIDLALKDFGMAIKLQPDYFVAHLNRGVVHRNDGRYEQALQDFGKVIELKPSVYAGYSNRGEVYRLKSDFDRAIVDYTKAIEQYNLNQIMPKPIMIAVLLTPTKRGWPCHRRLYRSDRAQT